MPSPRQLGLRPHTHSPSRISLSCVLCEVLFFGTGRLQAASWLAKHAGVSHRVPNFLDCAIIKYFTASIKIFYNKYHGSNFTCSGGSAQLSRPVDIYIFMCWVKFCTISVSLPTKSYYKQNIFSSFSDFTGVSQCFPQNEYTYSTVSYHFRIQINISSILEKKIWNSREVQRWIVLPNYFQINIVFEYFKSCKLEKMQYLFISTVITIFWLYKTTIRCQERHNTLTTSDSFISDPQQ